MNWKLLQLGCLTFVTSISVSAQISVGGPPTLLLPTTQPGIVNDNDKTVVRARNVIVEYQLLLNSDVRSIYVPLFDGDQVLLIRDSQTAYQVADGQAAAPKTGFIWRGHGANEPATYATFSVVNNVLIGDLRRQNGRVYHISYLGAGVHSLRQIDPSKFPPDGVSPPRPPKTNTGADTCSTDPPTDIDAMVVYTSTSRIAAGGQDAMEATIYLAVEYANTSYINSNINQRLRLVHLEEVGYTESGDFLTDVDRLQNPSDGFLDNVPPLRNTYAADVVGMIVEESAFCGQAYDILSPVSNAFESSAYAVINRSCATGNFSLAHEFGHLMGARHDWLVDPTNNSAFAYNHGYVAVSPTPPTTPWRTVMAYPAACGGCTRIPYWSNPNVNYPPGDPMGLATGQQSDNHRVLNNTALTVANFRCSSPSASKVWMKDTWDDTGVEPDPHTAGEAMWESPYIWIRNTQDTNLIYQHEHQNPIFGQTNWAYVKMHNGGAVPESGNLELYWAHASSGLSWPTDWTLLASKPVNGFAAHSTTVVEFKWDNLPGTGHYCLLARWNSASDPLTNPETTDVNYNVRYNNKLIWRNLNIVNLGGDQFTTASFIVRNGGKDVPTTLQFHPPSTELNNSFIQYGVVAVSFDSVLMRAWQQGGGQGTGFRRDDEGIALSNPSGAVFTNIALPPGATGVVTLTFIKLPKTPKRVYHLEAVQLGSPQLSTNGVAGAAPIGGVSYEITTEIQ